MTAPAPMTLTAMQQQGGAVARQADYAPGFGSAQSFELMIRQSKLLMGTTLVPSAYRSHLVKHDKYGNVKETRENPNALANCAVALNMATRMKADPLMVMQNLYIVEGRPSWSSQWIIAAINDCGRFSPLRFEIKVLGAKDVPYVSTFWENDQRKTKTETIRITDKRCIAWVTELATGERLESPPITIEMAVREGWYTKNGSKWQTMDEVMLRYRAASFFGKLYAPELLMGLQTREEIEDFIDMDTGEVSSGPVPMTDLRGARAPMVDEVQQASSGSPAADGEPSPGTATSASPSQDESVAFDGDAYAAQLERASSLQDLTRLVQAIPADVSDDLHAVLINVANRRADTLKAAEQPQGQPAESARTETQAPTRRTRATTAAKAPE